MRMESMKRKIGTILEEDLMRRAKILAAEEGKPLQRILEEALQEYLESRSRPKKARVVASTWGIIKADPALVRSILEEESALEA